MVHRVTAKEPKRSPSRGHFFLHRPICLFSLKTKRKKQQHHRKKKAKSHFTDYVHFVRYIHINYDNNTLLQTSILHKLAINH